MAFNPFTIRKWAALLIGPCIATVLYVVGNIFYGLIGGVGFFAAGLLLSVILGAVLLSHPFRAMVEGKGILAIEMSSTGILRPFIVTVRSPFIHGKVEGQPMKDVFDREAVFSLTTPATAGFAQRIDGHKKRAEDGEDLNGGLRLELTEEEFNKGRFAMYHYPVILYNSQMKTIITKDWLSEKEKGGFAEHSVLYLNRLMEELSTTVRDFARHVVETLKPGQSIFQNKWVLFIIIGAVIILLILFAPAIINTVKGFIGGGGATGAVSQLPANPITPR